MKLNEGYLPRKKNRMTTERLLLVYAQTEEEFQAFVEFLKKHFLSVIPSGTSINARDPFKDGVRAYVTVVGEAKEGKHQ